MNLRAPRGTFDILPEDWGPRRRLLTAAATVLQRAGVEEIATPIFEDSDVFDRSVGESADLVVQKEMYTLTRGKRSLTLRPEFTGGVLRAFIEHGMTMRPTPVKLWSAGPVFRAERPQRGRFHQFHQVNCELLGLDTPLLDAEAIALLIGSLQAAGLEGLTVRLGSVGDPDDRAHYNAYLREQLESVRERLSEASRERLRLNPMRILDSKDAGDQALLRNLKRPLDLLGPDAREHFEAVQRALTASGIPFEIDPAIVRGLDYYRRTAFEIHHAAIGAQSALCGGGRYDGLVERLGGPKTPGVGWAFGVERVLDALGTTTAQEADRPDLFLIPLDAEALLEVAAEAHRLRSDLAVQHSYAVRKVGKGLGEANRRQARFAALRGGRERDEGVYSVKDLDSGEQTSVAFEALSQYVRERTG
jgi:histidyl-tRNA synthetase